MTVPTPYGWFHLLCMGLTAVITVALCCFGKHGSETFVRRLLFITSLLVILLEVYKQLSFSFDYDGQVIKSEFLWYSFPYQFCSTPMYIGLIASLVKNEKLHKALCSYLATYAVFAGVCVMFYPTTVFIDTIGINIQSMICHGSMIIVGIYLLYIDYIKAEHKTILKAMPVFAVCVLLAMVMNEVAFLAGLLENHDFNMFFISPHCEPSLPVYSLVQAAVPFPFCVIIYFAGFSLASYVILLIAILLRKLFKKQER